MTPRQQATLSELQQRFYTDNTGTEHGPVSADELKQLGATGAIHALTDVWTEGLEARVPASEMEGGIPLGFFFSFPLISLHTAVPKP